MSHDTAQVAPPENDGGLDSGDPRAQERREALAAFWETVKRLPAYARLTAALARDPRVPHSARALLAAGGVYMVSPVDLIPGIIPVAGQIDDMYVVLMAIRQALRTVPDEVAEEYLERYQLDVAMIDHDLGVIRRLVRIGVTDGARWSWSQLHRLGRRLAGMVARRRSETG